MGKEYIERDVVLNVVADIDKVVEKATKEIVRKGLPKLLEGFKNE